jgi:hypothetical protein
MPEIHDESKRNRRTAKRILAIGLPLVVIAATGVGYASWNQSGAGAGSAKAATAVASVVTANTTTADLWPGQTAGKLYFHVSNDNPYPVTFTGVTAGAITAAGGIGTCTTTGVSVGALPANIVVAAGGDDFEPPIVAMSNLSDNGCQGATFTIALTLTGGTS